MLEDGDPAGDFSFESDDGAGAGVEDAAGAGVLEDGDPAGGFSFKGDDGAGAGVDDAGGSDGVAGGGAVCPYTRGESVKAKTPAAAITARNCRVGLSSTSDYPVMRPTAFALAEPIASR